MVKHIAQTNSLVNCWISELRNVEVQEDRMRFRRNMERIGEVIAYEISKGLQYETEEITTPLGVYNAKKIKHTTCYCDNISCRIPIV